MKQLIELYLSWETNFNNIDEFADFHALDPEDAVSLIILGEKYYHIQKEINELKQAKNL